MAISFCHSAGRAVLEQAEHVPAGVVDQHVDAAVPGDDAVDGGGAGRVVGDVAGGGVGAGRRWRRMSAATASAAARLMSSTATMLPSGAEARGRWRRQCRRRRR
jgi:hypothetical protein